MTNPISVDLPHSLGAAEAKSRIQNGIGRLEDYIPGGAEVRSGWQGDRMDLVVAAMGQEVTATIDVQEKIVRLEVRLPGVLSFFGGKVEALLRRHGTDLLEDRSGGRRG
jgi:Putative polyhydroxyalkanoic acid system protein (PHA_gran_rgn)